MCKNMTSTKNIFTQTCLQLTFYTITCSYSTRTVCGHSVKVSYTGRDRTQQALDKCLSTQRSSALATQAPAEKQPRRPSSHHPET